MTQQEILHVLKNDLTSGKVRVEVRDTYRCYTDGVQYVVIQDTNTTLTNYYNTFINPQKSANAANNAFDALPRCTIYVGPPDTGKTYRAQEIASTTGVDHILIMSRDSLNLETLLEDFTLVNGQPVFQESLAIKMLSGTDKCLIIIDEFNTLLTGVMKTLQPLLDNTSKTFEYKGKIYNKNLNCKFILTLNDKDKGISVIPDAILSRSKIEYFSSASIDTIANWTNHPKAFIEEAHKLYKSLDLLHLFGSRQINILHSLATPADVTSHLQGLCALRGCNKAPIDSVEIQKIITILCSMR